MTVTSGYRSVVDVDPELLLRSAEAAMHASMGGIEHVISEQSGDIERIIDTLAPNGPYGYTIRQRLDSDGTLRVPILSTRDEIYEEYKAVRSLSDILDHQPMINICEVWYLFHDVINTSRRKADGRVAQHHTLVLCPCKGSSAGITGEIFWYRSPRETLGRGDSFTLIGADRRTLLLDLYSKHEAYLTALRKADIEGMLKLINDSVQLAVRNYVEDTGTLTQPETEVGAEKTMYGLYWSRFFDRFEIIAIDQLRRVVEDWYIFAELRFNLIDRSNGRHVTFNTAEFMVSAKDGLFIAQIGHGTDIVAL